MTDLTMQTALSLFVIFSLIGLILVIVIYLKYHNQVKHVFYYTFFYFFSVLGATLILYREDLNSFLSIIVGNSFLLLSLIALSYSIHKFNGVKFRKLLHAIQFITYLALFFYFTYEYPSVLARIFVYGVFATIIILDTIISELKTTRKVEQRDQVMLGVLIVMLLIQLFRIIRLAISNEDYDSFFEFNIDAYSILFLGLSTFLISTGVFSKISMLFNNSLRETNRSNASLLGNLPGFAYRCKFDSFWTMEILSEGFKEVTGYEVEDCIGNKNISFSSLIFPEYFVEINQLWKVAVAEQTKFKFEYQIKKKDGSSVWIWEQGVAVYNEFGEVEALEGFISSVDERKELEKNLQYMSYHDSLTNIYNRRFIEEELGRLNTSRNFPLTIIMADINGLKLINDTFGHVKGDDLIKEAANILKSVLREDELLGRLGGDEFLIALPKTSAEGAEIIINRINKVIDSRAKEILGLSLSFGYATKETMSVSIESVTKKAEDNMYSNKTYNRASSNRKVIDAVTATLYEKDEYSESHSYNVSIYSKELAIEAGFNLEEAKKIETAGLLHDIGKIIINDQILQSSKALTEDEYAEIKKHSEIGVRILMSVPEFKELSNIILSHHEHIDGTGYPRGITGDEIPIEAKIIAIADAWDAMTSKRRYRKPLLSQDAVMELVLNKGSQFDAELVDIFVDKVLKNKKIQPK